MAHCYGWVIAHFCKVKTNKGWLTGVEADGKGWPDAFLCHEQRGIAIARELKVPPNKATKQQENWLRILNAVGIDARVWTPRDWDEIKRTLS